MALGYKNITVVDHHNYLLSSLGTEKAKSNCILFYGNLQVTRIGVADGKTAVRVAR